MTLSPTATSSGTRLPLSSMRPGPIAWTSPSWGFSLAVSGMTSPEAVVSSASSGLTTIRSSRGLMLTDTSDQPPLSTVSGLGSRAPGDVGACADVRRRGGRPSWQALAFSGRECHPETSTHRRRVPTRAPDPEWTAARTAHGQGRCQDEVVDLETFRWLLTDDGQALLAAATVAEGTPLEVQRRLLGLVRSGTTGTTGMTGATGSPGAT